MNCKSLSTIMVIVLVFISTARAVEMRGSISGEYRHFNTPAVLEEQKDTFISFSIEPEFYTSWNEEKQSITLAPFYRWDEYDEQRSHADLREFFWLYIGANYEIVVGIGKVFWGVTEWQHLVDIINQTDLVENIDGEDKLGQAMVSTTLLTDYGSFEIYVLPFFRERRFPGKQGRLRSVPYVEMDIPAQYESDNKNHHIDWAMRWSHNFDYLDLGISFFKGTGREPLFNLSTNKAGEQVLVPFYPQIQQLGLELQHVTGAWLWKLEAIYREQKSGSYSASTAGFEYTSPGLLNTIVDLGLVVEYLYDDRGDKAPTAFEDDIMLGLRISPNDVQNTQFLLALIKDIDTSGRMIRLESSRRLGDKFTLSLEASLFSGIEQTDPLSNFRRDDFAQAELAYHF